MPRGTTGVAGAVAIGGTNRCPEDRGGRSGNAARNGGVTGPSLALGAASLLPLEGATAVGSDAAGRATEGAETFGVVSGAEVCEDS